jgi:murein DD-endopeptidase MepM/ murein hydrolase activator NlpD
LRIRSLSYVAVTGVLALAASAPAAAMTGGAAAPPMPELLAAKCVPGPEEPCKPRGAVLRERRFVIRGRHLGTAKTIVFRGRRGRKDDVRVRVRKARARSIRAVVPRRARSGRLTIVDRYGGRSSLPRRVRVRKPAPLPAIDISPRNTFFFAGRRKPKFDFAVSRSMNAVVELVNIDTAQVIRSFTLPAGPSRDNLLRWSGLVAGRSAPTGRYRFRLAGAARSAAVGTSASGAAFRFRDHIFPIRGKHDYGTAVNRFGDNRGDHIHQGQDVMAACGTKLAAARGGKVTYAGYQGAAGNYVVIDGRFTDVSYVYMHLRKTPLVKTGQKVFTGQKLGEVGETGNAQGCHLHFELHNGAWYGGGRAFDPLPSLKRWDKTS